MSSLNCKFSLPHLKNAAANYRVDWPRVIEHSDSLLTAVEAEAWQSDVICIVPLSRTGLYFRSRKRGVRVDKAEGGDFTLQNEEEYKVGKCVQQKLSLQ